MMSKWERCTKLLKYSYGLKTNSMIMFGTALLSVLFFGIALVMEMTEAFMYSAALFFLVFMMLIQLKDNIVFSNLVISSGYRRFLELGFSDVLTAACGLLGYLVQVVLVLIFVRKGSADASLATIFIISGIAVAIFSVFFGFYNKFYVLGTIFSFCSYIILNTFFDLVGANKIGSWVNHNTTGGFVLGMIIVLVGALLAMVFRRLFYTRPYSKKSGSAGLLKSMQ